MSEKLIASSAIFISGFALFSAVLGAALLLHEINAFYDQTLNDMTEFKYYANDAWTTMLSSITGRNASAVELAAIFGRMKRQLDGGCECDASAMVCPRGPPGPRGRPGRPGSHGRPGTDGIPGYDAYSDVSYVAFDTSECFKCPRGMPGQPGPDGSPGLPGPDGTDGISGDPGLDGPDGLDGPEGDPGPDGEPGFPGEPGIDGEPGFLHNGPPGPPGSPGTPGLPGEAGQPGLDGKPGLDGPAGHPGFAGRRGMAGRHGRNGSPGGLGEPGGDGEYCPCPKRSSDFFNDVEKQNNKPVISGVGNSGMPSKTGVFDSDGGYTGFDDISTKQKIGLASGGAQNPPQIPQRTQLRGQGHIPSIRPNKEFLERDAKEQQQQHMDKQQKPMQQRQSFNFASGGRAPGIGADGAIVEGRMSQQGPVMPPGGQMNNRHSFSTFNTNRGAVFNAEGTISSGNSDSRTRPMASTGAKQPMQDGNRQPFPLPPNGRSLFYRGRFPSNRFGHYGGYGG